jgi:hypothetical protein
MVRVNKVIGTHPGVPASPAQKPRVVGDTGGQSYQSHGAMTEMIENGIDKVWYAMEVR